MPAHVGDWDQCATLIDATVTEFGRIDVLVNNAGIAPVPPSLLDVTRDLFDKTIGVNLRGPLRLTALAAEHMPGGGSVINISSTASLHPSSVWKASPILNLARCSFILFNIGSGLGGGG